MDTASERRSRWRSRLELSATILLIVVVLLVAGLAVWDRLNRPPLQAARTETPPPREPVSIDGAPIRGDRNAKVALIEFSEFQCPFCGRSARDVLPEIERQYLGTGKVFLAWRHYPLSIHEHAQQAAEAAECAGRQNKFWDFHDWAFQHQNALDDANLRAAAETLRLEMAPFGACLDGQATDKVKSDVDVAKDLSVSVTPTWFIGVVQSDGRVKVTDRFSGAKPLEVFQKALDNAIATVDSGK
jgi:protein-disulfide isomerase